MARELRVLLDGTAVFVHRHPAPVARAERVIDEFEGLIDGMTRDELLSCKASIEDEMASIRAQLEEARAHRVRTNQFADPDWYRRATAALRLKGRQCVRVQNRLSEMREAQKRSNISKQPTEHECFIRAARRLLSEEMYDRIWRDARRDAGIAND